MNKYIKIKRILLVLFILLIFFSANFAVIKNYQDTPQNTQYFGATGFFFDYYQFLSFMKDGERGELLLSSRYIPAQEGKVLLHPFFTVFGFLGYLLKLPHFVTYHLLKNIFLATWLVSLYFLVKKIIATPRYQKLAYFLLLVSGGFPMINFANNSLSFLPMIDFWKTFYALEKFIIPPHHLLANTLFVSLIIFLSDSSPGVLMAILSLLLFLVNPASMTFFLIVLTICFIYSMMRKNGGDGGNIVVFLSVLPFLGYYYYVFTYQEPWKYYYLGERVGRYAVSFFQYLGSLGLLLIPAFLAIVFIRKFRIAEIFLFFWILLPLLAFPLVGRQIPISMSRLFSFNLFIPTAILAVYFLENLKLGLLKKKIAKIGIILFFVMATIPGFIFSLKDVYQSKFVNYYNVFLPDSLLLALDFIRLNSKKETTVLAGENLSNLIPALTFNHVVIGREDVYAKYFEVKQKVDEVYLRKIDDKMVAARLREWRVQYLIFGLDQVGYEEFVKKGKIENIVKVFSAGEITVAENRL